MERRIVVTAYLVAGVVAATALACSTEEATSGGPAEAPITSHPAASPAAGQSDGGTATGAAPQPSAGCTRAATGEQRGMTLSVRGKSRRLDVVAPSTAGSASGYPLVFVFHGGSGRPEDARSTFDFPTIAPDKAIFVYPAGLDGNWDLDSATSDNEDIAFFDAMVANLTSAYCVDRSRIFATGSSMGAYFANQLGCRRGDVLRAIAPHAGGGPFDDDDNAYDDDGHLKCNGKPVAAMIFHGEDDGEVSIDDGQKSLAHWRWANGCSDKNASASPSPCVAYDGCKNPVVWCAIPGLGHDVWSQGAKATWAFFARF